jgi:hypothetical protein
VSYIYKGNARQKLFLLLLLLLFEKKRKSCQPILTIKENSNQTIRVFVIDKWTDDGMYRMFERESVHTINDEEYISTFQ